MAAEGDTEVAAAKEARIASLIAHGEESGCLELSEVSDLADSLELDYLERDALFDRIRERGIDISDDCGREAQEPVTYENGDLATSTMDALQLFFQEVREYPLLT